MPALCLRSRAQQQDHDAACLAACLAAGRAEPSLTATDLSDTDIAVAEVDASPAGLAQLTRGTVPAEMLKLFVDPPHIGRGTGKHLFQWAASRARTKGARRLRIEADPGALPFYPLLPRDGRATVRLGTLGLDSPGAGCQFSK